MSEGQVSETAQLASEVDPDQAVVTDDGIPPAEDAQQLPGGMPKDYSRDGAGRSGIDGIEDGRVQG